MVREVGGCGARVVLEIQRNHTKKKKNERGRKQEKIQQVVNFASIDYISAFTRYKKITFFISGQEFHLARLSSQAEQRTRIISSTCSASYEFISIY